MKVVRMKCQWIDAAGGFDVWMVHAAVDLQAAQADGTSHRTPCHPCRRNTRVHGLLHGRGWVVGLTDRGYPQEAGGVDDHQDIGKNSW